MVKIQQRGLGRGLSALITETVAVAGTPAAIAEAALASQQGEAPLAAGRLMKMPVVSMTPGRFQPRMRFTDEQLRELAHSIEKNGIMQPIVVRFAPSSGKYEIVAGERRWRAAQLAGLTEVPVLLRDMTDQQALELALIENIQRSDLSPLEEAMGYQRLIEEFGYTQDEVAQIIGKSRSHIANLLRLMTLPQEIKLLIDEGKLTAGHARALLGLPPEQALAIAQAVAERGLSVRQVEALARGNGLPQKAKSPRATPVPQRANPSYTQPKDADIIALEETLEANLGVSVAINDDGQGGGEIVLAYTSLVQLDEILRRLSAAPAMGEHARGEAEFAE